MVFGNNRRSQINVNVSLCYYNLRDYPAASGTIDFQRAGIETFTICPFYTLWRRQSRSKYCTLLYFSITTLFERSFVSYSDLLQLQFKQFCLIVFYRKNVPLKLWSFFSRLSLFFNLYCSVLLQRTILQILYSILDTDLVLQRQGERRDVEWKWWVLLGNEGLWLY